MANSVDPDQTASESDLSLHRLLHDQVTGIFFFQFWEGALGPFRLGKLAWLPQEICYSAQLCHFWSIKTN